MAGPRSDKRLEINRRRINTKLSIIKIYSRARCIGQLAITK